MSLLLEPKFANAFIAYYEEIWSNEWPHNSQSIFYVRYVDDCDCFVIFKSKDQVENFHVYLNLRYKNINFSIKHKNNKTLQFLHILIQMVEFKQQFLESRLLLAWEPVFLRGILNWML